jgi:DNA-binding IclR family transcriptional regulator
LKAAEQVLDLYARFAEAQAPLAPAELARRLNMAPSTCFNLIRTFEQRGFLYATGERRNLYPTRRMLALAQEIARHDPVGTELLRNLEALRDETGETVVLASRTRDRVVYLAVLASPHRIRYSAEVGETRPARVNSMGKALVSLLPPREREALAASFRYERLTSRTILGQDDYLADIERSIRRGWFLNDGESDPDVIAIAVPVVVHGSAFAVTLAGPRHRMADRIEERAAQVRAACRGFAAAADQRPAA